MGLVQYDFDLVLCGDVFDFGVYVGYCCQMVCIFFGVDVDGKIGQFWYYIGCVLYYFQDVYGVYQFWFDVVVVFDVQFDFGGCYCCIVVQVYGYCVGMFGQVVYFGYEVVGFGDCGDYVYW